MYDLIHDSLLGMVGNSLFTVFIIIMILDTITGVSRAFKQGALDSRVGINGLIRNVTVILLVISFYVIMGIMGYSSLSDVFILFYIAQFGLSILENLGGLDIPLPDGVKDTLERIYNHSNKGVKDFENKISTEERAEFLRKVDDER